MPAGRACLVPCREVGFSGPAQAVLLRLLLMSVVCVVVYSLVDESLVKKVRKLFGSGRRDGPEPRWKGAAVPRMLVARQIRSRKARPKRSASDVRVDCFSHQDCERVSSSPSPSLRLSGATTSETCTLLHLLPLRRSMYACCESRPFRIASLFSPLLLLLHDPDRVSPLASSSPKLRAVPSSGLQKPPPLPPHPPSPLKHHQHSFATMTSTRWAWTCSL